jgi:hypothetical protein
MTTEILIEIGERFGGTIFVGILGASTAWILTTFLKTRRRKEQ